ncbi:hypothetical protein [uncultured Parolsenella sp.]|uniref:hypothetical protein n=1 Tax=uncultured Parolsenella sp. TaxID=2083008 RepID=UPI0027D98DF9|nr:hypothetical protein [uncultured Parolsenella sp.]
MPRTRTRPTVTKEDLLDELQRKFCDLVAEYRQKLEDMPEPAGSRTLAFAVAAGMPVRMAYTLSDAAKITGVSTDILRAEHDAGRLEFFIPEGQTKWFRIRTDELDRWMEANSR